MRAAAILGPGCSGKDLRPFQTDNSVEWRIGMPASAADADAILLFGGDGTVHRHLGQLVKLGLPVLVVPAGSGNDFAGSLGLPRGRDSLTAWRKFSAGGGNVRRIDLGMVTPLDVGESPEPDLSAALGARYFCGVAGVGLDAEVARRANRLPRWLRGNGGYVLGLISTIFTFAPFPLKIFIPPDPEAATKSWTIKSDQLTLLAAFANSPLYGGGMKIAPQAKMDDGVLDVCRVGGIDPFKFLCMFPTVYAGKHLAIREVEYFQAPRLRVESERPYDVYADGEFVCRTPVEVAVQPAALRVITPGF
jgi:diacylglycerol kinase (ATP)